MQHAWGPITVRVAWTLASCGVALKPEVLRDARDHVWFHPAPDGGLHQWEDQAERLTRQFVARAYGRRPEQSFPEDDDMLLLPRWRRALGSGLSRNAKWISRMHYADGYKLSDVAKKIGEDVLALGAAREGLREVLRRAAAEDGVHLDGWPDTRLDHLLHRLAQVVIDDAPPLLEVVDGLHPEAMDQCIRSSRAYNLVRAGGMQRAELVAPRDLDPPDGRVQLLALQFHPDGQRHRSLLARELGRRVFPLGRDALVVDAALRDEIVPVLDSAAQVGLPPREHLRGTFLDGPGRWSRHGLIGPLVETVEDELRSALWGQLDDEHELPEQLPPPPSARRAWALVGLAAVVAMWIIPPAFEPAANHADHPLELHALSARNGVWLHFDVADEAYVTILRKQGDRIETVLRSTRADDKIAHAVGDGSYRLHEIADEVLIASTSQPLPDLRDWLDRSIEHADPLVWVAERVREDNHGNDVRIHPHPHPL